MKQKNLSKFAILLLVFLGIFIMNLEITQAAASCSITQPGEMYYTSRCQTAPCTMSQIPPLGTQSCNLTTQIPSYSSRCDGKTCSPTFFFYKLLGGDCSYTTYWNCTDNRTGLKRCSNNLVQIQKNNYTCIIDVVNGCQNLSKYWLTTANCTASGQICSTTTYTCVTPSATIWSQCSGTIYLANQTNTTQNKIQNCSDIGDVYWANLKGETITNTQLNDTVIISIATDSSAGSSLGLINQSINYSVSKFASGIFTKKIGWTLKTLKLSKFYTNTFFVNESGNYIANLSVNNSYSNESSYSSTGDEYLSSDNIISNSKPVSKINYPISIETSESTTYDYTRETRWSNLSAVSFNQSSYDEDDLLNITWDFGNGQTRTTENYSFVERMYNNSLGITNYTYPQSGRYYTKLTVSEAKRTNSDSSEAAIIILSPGINVIPIISSPIRGSVYGNSTIVSFDVSKSFIANCTTGIIANKNFTTDDRKLNCSYIHAPNDITYEAGTHLYWDLDLGEAGILSGRWNPGNVTFSKFYLDSSIYNIQLNITYNSSIITIGSASTYFSTAEWVCNSANSQAYWTTQGSSLQEPIYSSDKSIFGKCNMTVPYGKTCCPVGFACINGSCIVPPTGEIKYCSDLPDEKSCNYTSDNLNLAKNWISTINITRAEQCNDVDSTKCTSTSCSCKWNASTKTCNSIFEISQEGTCTTTPATGTCEWTQTSSEDHCGDSLGKMIITYTASGTLKAKNDPLCVNQVVEYPCSVSVKLPFFDGFTFIISTFGIALVYFMMRKK
jgi:hypothetical protein